MQGPDDYPELENQINDAFQTFEELLAVTQSEAAPNSHWRVKLESWRSAQGAWEKASTTPIAAVQDLKRCAVQINIAREMVEHADHLFLQVRDGSDPARAFELIQKHKELQQQATDLLREAENCYRAARNNDRIMGRCFQRTLSSSGRNAVGPNTTAAPGRTTTSAEKTACWFLKLSIYIAKRQCRRS